MLEAGVMLKRFGDLARQHVLSNISTLTDPLTATRMEADIEATRRTVADAGSPKGGASK